MRPALLAVLALALTGCFQMSSVLTVRADGSAVLREQLTLSGMGLMMLASETEDGADPWADLDLEARARTLGEGVRLASFEPAEDGFTSVYEIDDVEAIRFSLEDSFGPSDEVSELPMGYRFRLVPGADGAPATLRVFVPKPDPGKPDPPVHGGVEVEEAEGDDEVERGLQMMRGFIEDARLTVAVEVEGEVTGSTASFVEGSRVTLFDFPFVALIDAIDEDPDVLDRADGSPASALEVFNGLEGVRIQTPGTVRVEFQ